jgi:hypothetical protein
MTFTVSATEICDLKSASPDATGKDVELSGPAVIPTPCADPCYAPLVIGRDGLSFDFQDGFFCRVG